MQRFVALLVEDYADEWLWRPAMHYRWSYAHDRELLSSIIIDEPYALGPSDTVASAVSSFCLPCTTTL